MYFEIIEQIARSLKTIETWLSKAEQYAAAKDVDLNDLLHGRLAPDMGSFIYQVQSACDYVKGGAAWLAGQRPPKHEDNERTVQDLRARIHKTLDLVHSFKKEQYASAPDQRVVVSWGPPGKVLFGENYLLQVVMPNAYFHISIAYAILRHHGVDLGKKDFLGSIHWVDP
jgi:uncharacterized protein